MNHCWVFLRFPTLNGKTINIWALYSLSSSMYWVRLDERGPVFLYQMPTYSSHCSLLKPTVITCDSGIVVWSMWGQDNPRFFFATLNCALPIEEQRSEAGLHTLIERMSVQIVWRIFTCHWFVKTVLVRKRVCLCMHVYRHVCVCVRVCVCVFVHRLAVRVWNASF